MTEITRCAVRWHTLHQAAGGEVRGGGMAGALAARGRLIPADSGITKPLRHRGRFR